MKGLDQDGLRGSPRGDDNVASLFARLVPDSHRRTLIFLRKVRRPRFVPNAMLYTRANVGFSMPGSMSS